LLLLGSIILLLFSSVNAHPPVKRLHENIEKAFKSSVIIVTTKSFNRSFDPAEPFAIFFKGPSFVPKPFQAGYIGSGVLFNKEGFILTNNHVLKLLDPDFIKVVFFDGSSHFAEIVGKDPDTDIAIIKARTLPDSAIPATFSSSPLFLGEDVYAIGNPFNLGLSVTKGVVSAFNKSGLGIARFESFIQTDVPINSGNSGGALLNARGQVVGINTAIFTKSAGYMGISLAIPVRTVLIIKDQIMKAYHE
jgi:S1-C subfamily serine protease